MPQSQKKNELINISYFGITALWWKYIVYAHTFLSAQECIHLQLQAKNVCFGFYAITVCYKCKYAGLSLFHHDRKYLNRILPFSGVQ